MAEYYTPADLARFKAQMEQNYYSNNMLNNDLSTISNMTKNISPLGNLGIMLGTLGGKWAAQRYNDVFDKNIYNQRKTNERINNFINKANETFEFGPRWFGAGLPENGVFTSQLSAYLPNSKFYVNGEEWTPNFNFSLQGWQNPISVSNTNNSPTPSTELLSNGNQNNFTFQAPNLSLFNNGDFDWRNQNYFANVTRPSFLSIN